MKIYRTIEVQLEDRVAKVRLNRPEIRNAFDPVMIGELTEAFTEIASRGEICAVVLSGEGKSFCSGADLGYMKAMAAFSIDENREDSEKLFAMFWALRSCPQPVMGLVHGHVMGGALGLLALCDIAAAEADTKFCFSEVRLGLAPAVISPFVMEKVSRSFAHRYLLTAEVFNTDTAKEAGLLHHVGELDDFTESVLKTLLANGPEALRATKALLRSAAPPLDWKSIRKTTTEAIAERRVSDEGQEGLRGFLEKRAPRWATGGLGK